MQIGIVGYGGMGSYHHELIKETGNNVVAAHDIAPNRQVLAKNNGIDVCSSYDELLLDDRINTVLVALPNDLHFEFSKRAILANKNVLLEKPATIYANDFRVLTDLATQHNVNLTVHQNRRFDNDFLAVKRLIESGEIGKVYRIESCVMAANGIPGEWRRLKESGGGMLLDWGVHLIDQMVTLFGMTAVSAYYKPSYILGEEVEDGFAVEFTLCGGVTYSVTVDTNSFISRPRWTVYGTLGTASIETWGKPLKIIRAKGRNENIVGVKAGNGFTKTMARNTNCIENFEHPLENVDANIFYELLTASLARGEQLIPNNDVLYVLELMEKMATSKQSYIKF